jgi:hypothetical protein
MTSSLSNGQRERDDMPITLAQAAEIFGIGVATLRAEAGRGRLTVYRIGRQDRTTINDIRQMVELCRVEPKAPASIVTRRAVNTSSGTAAVSYDSAEQALLKLRNASRNILHKSTGPLRRGVR